MDRPPQPPVPGDMFASAAWEDAPREVHSWVENVLEQVDLLCARNGIVRKELLDASVRDRLSTEDAELLLKFLQTLVLLRNEQRVPPEYAREHSLPDADYEDARRTTVDFLRSRHLDELAAAIPEKMVLSAEAKERIREAREQGFDRMIVIPSAKMLSKQRTRLITSCATEHSSRLFSRDQYQPPEISNEALLSTSVDRPEDTPYLLLYSTGPVPEETGGLRFDDEVDLFREKHWNGLTLEEYLLLQRIEAEARGNHSFDSASLPRSPRKPLGRTFLLDSRAPSIFIPGSGFIPLEALWFGAYITIRSVGLDEAYPHLGARPTIVIPL